jgi:hypothetical protein
MLKKGRRKEIGKSFQQRTVAAALGPYLLIYMVDGVTGDDFKIEALLTWLAVSEQLLLAP